MNVAKLVVERKDVVTCSICGQTKEGYEIRLKWWIFSMTAYICQSCVARMLRGLVGGR